MPMVLYADDGQTCDFGECPKGWANQNFATHLPRAQVPWENTEFIEKILEVLCGLCG